jgi:hypothetical protein
VGPVSDGFSYPKVGEIVTVSVNAI